MSGSVLAHPRGRVLIPVQTRAPLDLRRWWGLAALVGLLPLFGETFAYVVDLPPVYALAKAWPLLTLPLAVLGVATVKAPGMKLVLLALAWMVGVTPLVSMATLGDSLGGALSGTIKLWSLAGVLSLSAVLAWLKPEARTLEQSVHILGFTTFALMGLIFLLTPPEAYLKGIEETKIFLWDEDRGARLNLPMFFAVLWVFLLNRRFWARPSLLPPLLIGAAFVLMLLIYKQRTQIAGAAGIVILAPVIQWGRRRGGWFGILIGLALVAAPFLIAVAGSHDTAASLGGSLTERQREYSAGIGFLNDQPLRWLIGAGGATRAGEVDLASVVGTGYFFTSDIGWVGVVFEYGVVGAALMLALHLVALRTGWRAAEGGSPLAWALFDYCLYLLLTSPVLSVVFAPGELATCLALMGALAVGAGTAGAAPRSSRAKN